MTLLRTKTGINHSDSGTKANILNEQFSSVFNKSEDTTTISDIGRSPYGPVEHIIITEKGVPGTQNPCWIQPTFGNRSRPTTSKTVEGSNY